MDRWFVLNTARIWLWGIIMQGERLLAVPAKIEQHLANSEFPKATQEELIKAMQERIIEEHFFVISVSKALKWLKEAQKIEPALQSNIEHFFSQAPDAKDVRDMREHDIDYFKGEGRKQSKFQKRIDVNQQKDAGLVDATSTIVCNEGYLIGGRLNVAKAISAAKELYPLISKLCWAKVSNRASLYTQPH